ncbi:cilia- and flagella-associated protein 418 isoform 3-T3 [Anomaloglossus baeobatrachus]|uniref:cilia- and flagella-associated protein 418 isoform X3 n=1 Tax=Anomaloglossus baeobatrachus TaxID=238106 RepID=UPI003F4FAC89
MADDDLDLLLDEVESKYCHPGPRGAASTGGAARKDGERSKNPAAITAVDDENVDDLIEDILDVRFYEENKSQNIKSPREQSCKASRQQPNKKCCPVYLGGSLVPFGLGTSVSERACDQLRCTSCDFNIVTFDDYKWDASCDYLFFRNSMPELSKLQTRMIRKKGARAYACQCSWRSIQQVTHLSAEEQLRWVCGKHSD